MQVLTMCYHTHTIDLKGTHQVGRSRARMSLHPTPHQLVLNHSSIVAFGHRVFLTSFFTITGGKAHFGQRVLLRSLSTFTNRVDITPKDMTVTSTFSGVEPLLFTHHAVTVRMSCKVRCTPAPEGSNLGPPMVDANHFESHRGEVHRASLLRC